MAVGTQVTVGTSPVALSRLNTSANLNVLNAGSTDIFLGGSDVTVTTGYRVAAGANVQVRLAHGESLWAVTATTGTAHVLRTG